MPQGSPNPLPQDILNLIMQRYGGMPSLEDFINDLLPYAQQQYPNWRGWQRDRTNDQLYSQLQRRFGASPQQGGDPNALLGQGQPPPVPQGSSSDPRAPAPWVSGFTQQPQPYPPYPQPWPSGRNNKVTNIFRSVQGVIGKGGIFD